MSKNDKKLLIVERCNAPLLTESVVDENNEKSIILSGIFTTFNTMNRNKRIYEAADVLPHIEALREKIDSHTLLGELDHPQNYDITLSNVSHVIESLEYDRENNCIVGKVRLLNTSKGKEAQALVHDGIPLHISSRAAGSVDANGHVKMQQLFTYDLVADPGFANAKLARVNESYGFDNDDELAIFDLNPDTTADKGDDTLLPVNQKLAQKQAEAIPAPTEVKKQEEIENKNNNMDNTQYIKFSDFQKYTTYLSDIITNLQSAISNYKTELVNLKAAQPTAPTQEFAADKVDNSQIEHMIDASVSEKIAEVEEKYEQLKQYTNYLSEKLNQSISHQDYLAENLDDTIKYQNYIAENLDKSIDYSNYLAEEQNKSIAHQDYLAENMDKMIAHQDYLAENLDKSIKYSGYLAENLDKSIDYSNYLAENLDKSIDYANYLGEGLNKSIAYSNYIAEQANADIKAIPINEARTSSTGFIGEPQYQSVVKSPIKMEFVKEKLTKDAASEIIRLARTGATISAIATEIMNTCGSNPNFKCFEGEHLGFINHIVGYVIHEQSDILDTLEENAVVETYTKGTVETKNYQQLLMEKLNTIITNATTSYDEVKKMEAQRLNESRQAAATSKEDERKFDILQLMPEYLKEKWNALSERRKDEILNESKTYILDSPYLVENFWRTRDLREELQQVVNESVVAHPQEETKDVMQDEYMRMLSEQIKYKMRKY